MLPHHHGDHAALRLYAVTHHANTPCITADAAATSNELLRRGGEGASRGIFCVAPAAATSNELLRLVGEGVARGIFCVAPAATLIFGATTTGTGGPLGLLCSGWGHGGTSKFASFVKTLASRQYLTGNCILGVKARMSYQRLGYVH